MTTIRDLFENPCLKVCFELIARSLCGEVLRFLLVFSISFKVEEITSPSNKDAIAARCYSCGKIVKGNRGISSNFIKHMKRSHPEINKMYETFKAQKSKIGQLQNRMQISREFPAANENGDNNSFLITESKGAYESSEDNDEDSTLMTNREILETNENSKESLQPIPINNQNTTIELSSKTLEAIGNIIDEKLKHFVKQTDYNYLNEKVDMLTKLQDTKQQPQSSSSPATIGELKTEVENLKKECLLLRSAVQKSQASKRQLQNELQIVDKLLHQRKLIIRNIIVHEPEHPLRSVEKLFRERLNLYDMKIVNCCIIPAIESFSIKESNKVNLSVEMENTQDCKLILKQVHKLKNTGIFIELEISKFQRQRKNKLMVLRKELLKRKSDLKILIRDITLIVNGKKFYWDDVEGLCHDGKQEDALELNGVEYLNVVTGLDLKEFVNVLQNYNVQIT